MHLSDTLVIGPLPLKTRTVRLPVGFALAVGVALIPRVPARFPRSTRAIRPQGEVR
jgi:hypothetical protein